MKTVTYNGTTYRLPFADLFRDLTDDETAGLRASIKAIGIVSQVLTYDSPTHGDDCVIDGANRLTLGVAAKADVPIRKIEDLTDAAARAMAEDLNDKRRHLSPAEQKTRRAARIKRAAKMRAEGNSLRAIAESEGVSLAQIRDDLETAGVQGCTPETVTGTDGKSYPATKPQVSSPPDDESDTDPEDHELAPESRGEINYGPADPDRVYLDDKDDPAKPPEDANWRLPDGSVERPEDLTATTPDVMDDPAARVEKIADRFKNLIKAIKSVGTELSELLNHHQAGHYLRHTTGEHGSAMFVERPRVIRSGKHEGGWHSPELALLQDAVKRAAVDRLCTACRGGGCSGCGHAGFYPAGVSR